MIGIFLLPMIQRPDDISGSVWVAQYADALVRSGQVKQCSVVHDGVRKLGLCMIDAPRPVLNQIARQPGAVLLFDGAPNETISAQKAQDVKVELAKLGIPSEMAEAGQAPVEVCRKIAREFKFSKFRDTDRIKFGGLDL